MMDENSIYKAEHEAIADAYDWIMDHDQDGKGVHYVSGIHDFASYLISMMNKGKESKE